jgi:hypothetical protein
VCGSRASCCRRTAAASDRLRCIQARTRPACASEMPVRSFPLAASWISFLIAIENVSEAPPVLGVLSRRTSIFPGARHPLAWDSFLCNSLSSNSQCRRGRQAPRRAGVGVDSCLPNGVCRYRVHHISATRNARQAITSTVVINSGLRATRSFQALYIVAPSSRGNNFWARTHSPAVAGWQRS